MVHNQKMTPERAIEILTHISDHYWVDDFLAKEPYVVFDKEFTQAVKFAVSAIQQLVPREPAWSCCHAPVEGVAVNGGALGGCVLDSCIDKGVNNE